MTAHTHPHTHHDHHDAPMRTTTLHVGGLHYASEKAVVERVLGRQPGVVDVEANPVSQTATVDVRPGRRRRSPTLQRWVEECGYHCAGQSVPGHLCDPMLEPGGAPAAAPAGHEHATAAIEAAAHDHAAMQRADEAHGHGHGGHAGMSMAEMVRDMRNRFLVAVVFAIPIAIWSELGDRIFGGIPPTPFGMRDDVWEFLLSLPVIFYACQIFFVGAWHALRARTLDMMVLVAVAIGTGWLYSVAATFFIEGEVFYEAAAFLAAFVLLGHWFEMRARGGANDAIRALLDLAPPKATVIRDGVELEIPTAEVQVGELLLIRPGSKVPVDARGARGRELRRRVDGDRREHARLQAPRRDADRRDDQQERHAAGTRDRGRHGHCPRADREARPGGAELEGSGAAARRQGRLLARARRPRRRRRHLPRLEVRRRRGHTGSARLRDHRRRHHLPGRARARHPHRDHGRHRPRRTARHPLQERRSRSSRPPSSTPSSSTRPAPSPAASRRSSRSRPPTVFPRTMSSVSSRLRSARASIRSPRRSSQRPKSRGLATAKVDRFEAVPGHGALATVEGKQLAIGNGRLLERESIELDGLMPRAA